MQIFIRGTFQETRVTKNDGMAFQQPGKKRLAEENGREERERRRERERGGEKINKQS